MVRQLDRLLIIFFTAVLLFSCSKKDDEYIPPAASVVDKQFNFHIVTPGFWRSSQPNEYSLKRMKMHGLKTIINLRGSKEADVWEHGISDSLGINYFNFPIDARKKPDVKLVEKILTIINDTSNQPVLVHCLGGKDRTGLIAGAYEMQFLDADFTDVREETVMFGHDSEKYPYVLKTIENWKKLIDDNDK